jgi:hypothetical protein
MEMDMLLKLTTTAAAAAILIVMPPLPISQGLQLMPLLLQIIPVLVVLLRFLTMNACELVLFCRL